MRGKTLRIKGELRSTEDLSIEGYFQGNILCEGAVVLEASAEIAGDVLAQDITIFGRCAGQLTATDIVDVRDGANVTGRVVSKRFVLEPGATFNGRVEPQHLEAALSVARFRERKRQA